MPNNVADPPSPSWTSSRLRNGMIPSRTSAGGNTSMARYGTPGPSSFDPQTLPKNGKQYERFPRRLVEWIRLYDDLQVYLDRKTEYFRPSKSMAKATIVFSTSQARLQETKRLIWYNLFWKKKYIQRLTTQTGICFCCFHRHVFFWEDESAPDTLALSNLLRSNKAWETSWPHWTHLSVSLGFQRAEDENLKTQTARLIKNRIYANHESLPPIPAENEDSQANWEAPKLEHNDYYRIASLDTGYPPGSSFPTHEARQG